MKKARKVDTQTKRLKTKLWKIFSRYIRLRDKFSCYTCSTKNIYPANCHAGHFIAKGLSSGVLLYFDERNVHAQCISCNVYKSGNLAVYALHLEEDYGKGVIQELFALKNRILKPTADWYEEKIKYYTERVKEMEEKYYKKK